MAMNNRDRVGKAFDLLSEGLLDEVDEVMTRATSSWGRITSRHGRSPEPGSSDTLVRLTCLRV